MNAAKALKLKNRLAGEVARLKGLALEHNSYVEGRLEQSYDVRDIVCNQLPLRIVELCAVKTGLAVHNAGGRYDPSKDTVPANAIYMIAEYKGLIDMLRNLVCIEGNDIEHRGGFMQDTSGTGAPIVRKCWVTRTMADARIKSYESWIDKLQDQLDAANAVATLAGLDDIKL